MTGRMMMRRLVLIVAALRFLITTTALTTTDGDETYTKNNSNNNNNNAVVNQTSVLLKTSIVYGALLVLGWILFCWVRQRFPRPYTIRQWSTRQDLKVPREMLYTTTTSSSYLTAHCVYLSFIHSLFLVRILL